ncbi:hypothetical protein AMTR_s00101p00085590 [Amborella trichopoda]|uniref:Uncharacterized protein n=1 Tax=Amborella trichopoda TaxID=13333 RepID=W1NUX5_AMBTC|nr:hypothetical protein AMTR_s00101p00085590 [Amborella trichopoda]
MAEGRVKRGWEEGGEEGRKRRYPLQWGQQRGGCAMSTKMGEGEEGMGVGSQLKRSHQQGRGEVAGSAVQMVGWSLGVELQTIIEGRKSSWFLLLVSPFAYMVVLA